jgi:predicted nucleic acid-binding protein
MAGRCSESSNADRKAQIFAMNHLPLSKKPQTETRSEFGLAAVKGQHASGKVIGNNDLWIAAHAMAAGLTLVTNNEKEFRRVKGLPVQNWAK